MILTLSYPFQINSTISGLFLLQMSTSCIFNKFWMTFSIDFCFYCKEFVVATSWKAVIIVALITTCAYFALKKAIKNYFLLKCEFGDNIYKHNFFAYKCLTLHSSHYHVCKFEVWVCVYAIILWKSPIYWSIGFIKSNKY